MGLSACCFLGDLSGDELADWLSVHFDAGLHRQRLPRFLATPFSSCPKNEVTPSAYRSPYLPKG